MASHSDTLRRGHEMLDPQLLINNRNRIVLCCSSTKPRCILHARTKTDHQLIGGASSFALAYERHEKGTKT